MTEHHLEYLSSKGGCTGSSESTHTKMPHCWKSHIMAHNFLQMFKVFKSVFKANQQKIPFAAECSQ